VYDAKKQVFFLGLVFGNWGELLDQSMVIFFVRPMTFKKHDIFVFKTLLQNH
jgi:hypothetical protein